MKTLLSILPILLLAISYYKLCLINEELTNEINNHKLFIYEHPICKTIEGLFKEE